jgi:tetratricopeptide (TPR) repeat protein
MSIAQLKKKAADFELKKQFDKAIQVYIQILNGLGSNVAEVDLALFNRVGDLLLRQGNVADALDYYERAVDRYAEGGFFNNAIALCNKILRNSPGRATVYYKLGKISAQKGFTNEAKQNFLEYADRMQKSGRMDEAFRALKEFADLCPDQDDIRQMLADQLTKQNRGPEALEQLQLLYDRYQDEGKEAQAQATLDRMKAIDPSFRPRTSGSQRRQKSDGLVFLDLGEDEAPKAPGQSGGQPGPSGLLFLDTGEPTPSPDRQRRPQP